MTNKLQAFTPQEPDDERRESEQQKQIESLTLRVDEMEKRESRRTLLTVFTCLLVALALWILSKKEDKGEAGAAKGQ